MSKIFGTLAAVLLAIAAFVAFKNKGAKAAEDNRLDTAKKLEASRIKEFNKETDRRNAADALRQEYLAKAEELETELEAKNEDYQKAKDANAALMAEHAAKGEEIAEADEILKELPDPDVLVPKIKRMRSELAEATNSIESEKSRLANLAELDKNGKIRIKGTRELIGLQSSGKSFPTLKTSISSIYRNWGFVILAAGDSQGVVSGSTLDVVRGGEVIGKLKVTAVEAGRASADIVLDSVAAGTTLQAGDSVVAEQEEKPTATAAK